MPLGFRANSSRPRPVASTEETQAQVVSSILAQLASSQQGASRSPGITSSPLAPVHRASTLRASATESESPGSRPAMASTHNGALFVGPLPHDMSRRELIGLLHPHRPSHIYFRSSYRRRYQLIAKVIYPDRASRNAALERFSQEPLPCLRFDCPIRVEPYQPNLDSNYAPRSIVPQNVTPSPREEIPPPIVEPVPAIPETPETSHYSSPPPDPSVEAEWLEETESEAQDEVPDEGLVKKRKNLKARLKLAEDLKKATREYKVFVDEVQKQIQVEKKLEESLEESIRKARRDAEFSKNRQQELEISLKSLNDQRELTISLDQHKMEDLLKGWSDLNLDTMGKEVPLKNLADSLSVADLECIVCVEPMLGTIFQCRNGHCVCGPCFHRLESCGLCRTPLERPGIRCRLLETLVQKIAPNLNSDSGNDSSTS
eukprot:maker-scaffold269_size230758-snap-gene-1.38 protein:Tk07995 transcript:maker-scaffold269_size230758-snap-gene-1.38-mRNA-1 annotation:"hypothetical protein "